MKFLADEGIDRSIVQGLRNLNHDVFYVVEQERSLEDEVLLAKAKEEGRIMITRDKDFGELSFRLNKLHSGIILVRLEGYNTMERGEIVCKLVHQHLNELQNSFTVIQPGLIRIRPIEGI